MKVNDIPTDQLILVDDGTPNAAGRLVTRALSTDTHECIDHERRGDTCGYLVLQPRKRGKQYSIRAHKLVYCCANNVPLSALEGKVVRHACDNPRCVNPKHLEIGTVQDNMRDRTVRGRVPKGGAGAYSVLTTEQVLAIRSEYVPHKVTARALAAKYGVGYGTVRSVLDGRSWAHV